MNKRGAGKTLVVYAAVVLIGFIMVAPFFWLVSASLQQYKEIISDPLTWLPKVPQWRNYREVLANPDIPILLYFRNSFIVTGAVVLLVLATSTTGGYALAKLRFPGRDLIFNFILSTMMFPTFIFLIPVYYILKRFPLLGGNDLFGMGGSGALGSHLALILPFMVSAYGIFLMRQFMMTIPDELLDAARVDGAGEFRIFASVTVPQVRPALATLAIFNTVATWNQYLWPMIISTNNKFLRTIPVGITMMGTAYGTDLVRNKLFAATVLAAIPTIIVFLALQRNYIKGMVMTGIK